MMFARKTNNIPEFSRTIFARKMPKFYEIFGQKYFLFGGGGGATVSLPARPFSTHTVIGTEKV